jgi:hypothetical protein
MMPPYTPPSLRHFEPRRPMRAPDLTLVPFVYDLVHALRPALVADLGTGHGAALFACCQSMRDHDVDGVAYAIDAWATYTGEGAPTYDEVNAHGRQFYMGIAYFVHMEPRHSVDHFADGSVSLAVMGPGVTAEDAPVWASKVGHNGAILVRDADTPPGKELWAALASERGSRFELAGLGIFLGPGAPPGELVGMLRSPDEHDGLRRFYAHVAEYHRLRQLTSFHAFFGKKKPQGEGGRK